MQSKCQNALSGTLNLFELSGLVHCQKALSSVQICSEAPWAKKTTTKKTSNVSTPTSLWFEVRAVTACPEKHWQIFF